MRLGFYFRYTTRSLRRGGSRTLLAGCCVAVGVMAIVGLQLAAAMVTDSLTSNVREANGGDISVVSVAVPFPSSQLRTFATLKREGEIENFTAIRELAATLIRPGGRGISVTIDAVDPKSFPLVGSLGLRSGALGDFHQLLSRRQTMVVSGGVASLLEVGVGHRTKIDVPGATLPVSWTVGGVLAENPPAGMDNDVLVSSAELDSVLPSSSTPEYGEVYVTTRSSARADQVAKTLRSQFPLATVSTVKQALNSDKKASQQLTQFLSIAGLAALLIGGIGIVNTMQVSLARRHLEIAMLKTTGYRRRDLYTLFALEAALLGLGGGIVGAGVVSILDRMRRVQQRHRRSGTLIRMPGGVHGAIEGRLRAGEGWVACSDVDRSLRLLGHAWREHGSAPVVQGVTVRPDVIDVMMDGTATGPQLPDGCTIGPDGRSVLVDRASLCGPTPCAGERRSRRAPPPRSAGGPRLTAAARARPPAPFRRASPHG